MLFFPLFIDAIPVVKFESAEFEPETIRTGDNVFCRIRLEEKADAEKAADISTEKNSSFEIKDIKFNLSGDEILIWFIPFNPLEKHLPVIKTSSFVLEKIPVEITGYAEAGDTVPDPPGPMLIPGTRLFFGFLFFILSFSIFLIYYFIRFFYKPVKSGIGDMLREVEIKKILSAIRSIDKELSLTAPGVFCSRINSLFKQYLEKRLASPFLSLTSAEIADKLLLLKKITPEEAGNLKKSLYISDRIRFSKYDSAARNEIILITDSVISAAETVEKDFRKKEVS